MKKYLLIAASLAALFTASPAMAQAVTPQTSSSTPTTGCATCQTGQVGITTIGQIGGQIMAFGGAYDSEGNDVVDDTLEVEIEGYKHGTLNATGVVTVSGPACITCAQTSVNGRVEAQEQAGISVMLSGKKPGHMYVGSNSAVVGAAGAIGTMFQASAAPTTHPSTK